MTLSNLRLTPHYHPRVERHLVASRLQSIEASKTIIIPVARCLPGDVVTENAARFPSAHLTSRHFISQLRQRNFPHVRTKISIYRVTFGPLVAPSASRPYAKNHCISKRQDMKRDSGVRGKRQHLKRHTLSHASTATFLGRKFELVEMTWPSLKFTHQYHPHVSSKRLYSTEASLH